MGNVLSLQDAQRLHASSKISDTDIGFQSFTCIANALGVPIDGADWNAAATIGPFGRPVTVRLYLKVTSSVSVTVTAQPDHVATPLNPNAPHQFHDTTQDIGAFSGVKIVDVKGSDIIILTPSGDAGISTVIAVPLYY